MLEWFLLITSKEYTLHIHWPDLQNFFVEAIPVMFLIKKKRSEDVIRLKKKRAYKAIGSTNNLVWCFKKSEPQCENKKTS